MKEIDYISCSALLEMGKAKEAIERLEELNKRQDENYELLNDIALAKFAVREYEEAEAILIRLVEEYPKRGFAKINLFYLKEMEKFLKDNAQTEPQKRIKSLKRASESLSPKVSILMPSYNRNEFIGEALRSIFSQTFKGFEVIVINDGGDNSIEKILERLWEERIVYVYSDHSGLSGALNVGFSVARGDWIAYLDDDDIYYPNHLELIIEGLLKSRKKVGYTNSERVFLKRNGDLWQTVRREKFIAPGFSAMKFREENYVLNLRSVVHHRECIDKIGGFDERIKYSPDWDFLIRLSKSYEFEHIGEITGEYRVREGSSQMTKVGADTRNYYRNLILYKNNLFPLVGFRKFSKKQGDGDKLDLELGRLVNKNPGFARSLELRKFFSENYYSIFYHLAKRYLEENRKKDAKDLIHSAIKLSPFEPKLYFKLLKTLI